MPSKGLVGNTLGPFFNFMDVSFKSIAFSLQFSSTQIDAIYSLLDIKNTGDQKIPVCLLKEAYFVDNLPGPFKRWLETCSENVNIVFEQSVIDTQPHNDWELINYD